jgi:hypothetical protein
MSDDTDTMDDDRELTDEEWEAFGAGLANIAAAAQTASEGLQAMADGAARFGAALAEAAQRERHRRVWAFWRWLSGRPEMGN